MSLQIVEANAINVPHCSAQKVHKYLDGDRLGLSQTRARQVTCAARPVALCRGFSVGCVLEGAVLAHSIAIYHTGRVGNLAGIQ